MLASNAWELGGRGVGGISQMPGTWSLTTAGICTKGLVVDAQAVEAGEAEVGGVGLRPSGFYGW